MVSLFYTFHFAVRYLQDTRVEWSDHERVMIGNKPDLQVIVDIAIAKKLRSMSRLCDYKTPKNLFISSKL